MNAWCLDQTLHADAHAAMAGVIDAVGRDRFAASALASLNRVLGIGSWAVYRLWRDRPPVMHLSASHGTTDTTADCFATYRDRQLYQCDSSFEAVRRHGHAGRAVMLQMQAEEAPSAEHRDAIYRRHGMLERLSVARTEVDGSLLAVNVYRHAQQGCSGSALAERFGSIASALFAGVVRHLEWSGKGAGTSPRDKLRARCPALTPRELDVLDRLLQGVTYDGIAADLKLSVCTVKTYRARAFDRLNIHFKSELFALFVAPVGQAMLMA